MIINEDKVLLQIPKCATMSTMFIGNKYTKDKKYVIHNRTFPNIHSRYDQGVKLDRIKENMKVFAICRNPYNRVASSFFFRRFESRRDVSEQRLDQIKKRFEKFVLESLETVYNQAKDFENKNGMIHYFYRTQCDYIRGCPKEQLRIINLDDKTDFIQGLKEFFDVDIDLNEMPQRHRSLGMPSYKELYTPAMIDVVNKLYKEDFDFFGFSMLNGTEVGSVIDNIVVNKSLSVDNVMLKKNVLKPPTKISLKQVGTTSVNTAYLYFEDENQKVIRYDVMCNPGQVMFYGVKSPVKIYELVKGIEYSFCVRAVNEKSESEFSEPLIITI